MTRPPRIRPTVMDKDRLAAFVDDEMSPEQAAAVVMHLADHPQDQAHVDDLMAANAALALAFSAPMGAPVPDALRDLVLGAGPEGKVVPFHAKRRPAVALWGGLGVALAAGLAVAVFTPGAAVPQLTPGPLAGGSALHAALDTLPAGEVRVMEGGAEAMVLGSVPTPGGYCREIEERSGRCRWRWPAPRARAGRSRW